MRWTRGGREGLGLVVATARGEKGTQGKLGFQIGGQPAGPGQASLASRGRWVLASNQRAGGRAGGQDEVPHLDLQCTRYLPCLYFRTFYWSDLPDGTCPLQVRRT